jgi:hypothetical protein
MALFGVVKVVGDAKTNIRLWKTDFSTLHWVAFPQAGILHQITLSLGVYNLA